jgi:hypothetical protein
MSSFLWLAAVVALLGAGVLVWLCRALGYFDPPFDPARLALRAAPAPPTPQPPRTLRAFYSGHSLSDGVPEVVAGIARSLGREFEFEFQSLPGSLIRARTMGDEPGAPEGSGFRSGKNRNGSGLDVEAALRARPTTGSSAPTPYDVLVVTERHDLPYAVLEEGTVQHLLALHDRLIDGNPRGQTLFYHTWLEVDPDDPAHFIEYERKALVLWECVASAVNRRLAASQRADRLRVLPGGTALAALLERVVRGEVAGAPGDTAAERVGALFEDRVHLNDLGRFFLGAVHYAALFHESPQGAALPPNVAPELGAEMLRLAWEHVSAYSQHAAAASERGLDVCADYTAKVLCPLFAAHPRSRGPVSLLDSKRRELHCRRRFSDVKNPEHALR